MCLHLFAFVFACCLHVTTLMHVLCERFVAFCILCVPHIYIRACVCVCVRVCACACVYAAEHVMPQGPIEVDTVTEFVRNFLGNELSLNLKVWHTPITSLHVTMLRRCIVCGWVLSVDVLCGCC